MPIILYVLFAVAMLPITLAIVGGVLRMRQCEKFDNHHPRFQQSQLTGMAARAVAAQANAWEALMVFLAVCFVAYASGLDLTVLTVVALVYLGARICHGIFYLLNWATLRSLAFAIGLVCYIYIFIKAVMQYST